MRRLMMAVIGLLVATATFAQATPEAADAGRVAFRIEPRIVEGVDHGKAAIIHGGADAEGHRFFLDNLNMTVPVSVTLMAARADDVLKLDIRKLPWAEPVRSGQTGGGTSVLNERFRTQGEFQIAVSAPETETPYQLVVWVGDEVKPDLRPVVLAKSEYEAAHDAGSPALWLIAILLFAILAVLTFLAMRRRRA